MSAVPVRQAPVGTQIWVEIEATTADDLTIAGRLLTAGHEQRVLGVFADDHAGSMGHHVTDLRIGTTVIPRSLWDPIPS